MGFRGKETARLEGNGQTNQDRRWGWRVFEGEGYEERSSYVQCGNLAF